MSPAPSSIYAESRVALLTQHGKEGVIAPVLDTALGCPKCAHRFVCRIPPAKSSATPLWARLMSGD